MTGANDGEIRHVQADYAAVLAGLPPLPLAPGPVHVGGSSATDATMAAFGAATNADLAESNTDLAVDDTDRRAHAGDAIGKFAANESAATAGFGGVGAEESAAMTQQLPQAMSGALSGVAGALGGALGAIGRIPQELMQAGQGAIQPLMSAMQTGAGDPAGIDDAELADDVDTPDSAGPGLDGFDSGSGGLTPGIGTTPAGPLGPPPVPTSSAPTVPAAAATKSVTATTAPPTGTVGPGAAGAGMMPLLPGGGAGGDKSGRGAPPQEKRISAPPVANGQPVKGRAIAPPNLAVTKSAAVKPIPPLVTRKHVIADDEAPR